MRLSQRAAWVAWLTGWAAATAVSLALTRPSKAPINVDEVYWIGSSYYYYLAFHERDWTHPDWKLMSARENPPVAKYLIGARLALADQYVVNRQMISCFRIMFEVPPERFRTFKGHELFLEDQGSVTREECGRAPLGGPGVTRKAELLALSRQAIVACGIVGSLLLFLFGASIANRATGLVASQVLLLHDVALEAYSHAMSDAVAMMFSIAAAFAAWHFHRRMASDAVVSRRSAAAMVLLNGALLALACGAKMNALIVVVLLGAGALAAAIIAWRRHDRGRARLTLGLATASGFVALAVFVLINPAILMHPVEGLPAVYTWQNYGIVNMRALMPDRALVTLGQKFGAVTQVASGPLPFLLVAALAALAAVRRPRPGVWFVAGWWLMTAVVVTLWIPFQWARYALPVVPPMALFVAYALTTGAAALAQLGRRGYANILSSIQPRISSQPPR